MAKRQAQNGRSMTNCDLSVITICDILIILAIIYFDYTIQLQLTMYSTPPNIIQWNCNGLQLHLPEIQLIKSRCNPTAFILQETHLRPEQSFRLRGFTSFRKDLNPDGRAKGGVAIFLRDSIHAQEIRINTRLQAVAIQIHSPRKLTLCSIYLPDYHWNMQEIQNILHQLPEPALIMGDFNAHSPLWGSETRDSRGRRIEILLEQENICLANSGEATHFNARSNSFSSIDLTLCTPQIIPALTWKPLEDLHSSDHFPIQINFDTPERNRTPGEKWLIKKANWDVFSSLVSLPNPDLFEEINDAVDAATNAILLAAHSAIPKAMSKGSSKSVPWWNESIKLAITSRNKALRVFEETLRRRTS
ncbi:hypothetical protein JTB14_009847 [Gonioctena quinquepunctata]|nr:hypothetical protein JTB14_009847 [Gonioctena quinquepunctata]